MTNAQQGKKGIANDDERLRKDAGADTRADRSSEDSERTNEDGTIQSSVERRRMLRNEWNQEALPTVPEIKGYHLIWLSSTSSYDPLHKRLRMGYEPVKAEEIAGFDVYKMKSGQWDGHITCNEMVLFKIRDEIFQEIMETFHHDMPLEEEQRIRQSIQSMESDTDSDGKRLSKIEGDGFSTLAQRARKPSFA